MPALRRGLHAAAPDRPVHGLGRRRVPHLVGRRRPRERLGGPQGAGSLTPGANETRMTTPAPAVVSRRLLLTGRVQGVGFRPFVYRLAHELRLDGFVRNLRGDVEIVLQGEPGVVDRFTREVVTRAPPLARPVVADVATAQPQTATGFTIAPS